MARASARFANRCRNGRRVRPHRCATFCKCCTKMRSNRPSAGATARKSHAHALRARARKLAHAC
eukprot:11184588-Lingulodinium_polyedra.AAC.1